MQGCKHVLLWKKKNSCSVFTVFVCENLSIAMFFLFLRRFLNWFFCFFFWKVLAIVTKCSILDIAGVLNPLQYVLEWIAHAKQTILFKYLAKDSNWSLWVQCMTIIFYLIFKIQYQSTKTWSIGEVVCELSTK